MDENFDELADELPDDVSNTADETPDDLTQSIENVWDKVEDAAEQAGDQTSQAAENAWERIEEAAETAGKQTEQVAENVWDHVEEGHAEELESVEETVESVPSTWSEVKEEVIEDSALGKVHHEHTYGDEYVPDISDKCCEPDVNTDPLTSAEFASSPIGLGPDLVGPTITAQDVRAIRSDHIVNSQKKARKEKDFPVWAIILIILLVLCICVILPVLFVFGGGFVIFRDLFGSISTFLPYLFV